MAIHLGRSSPNASRDRPERRRGRLARRRRPRPMPPAAPTWSCSRWGLPCRRRCRRRGALLPHHFTLAARYLEGSGLGGVFLWHFPWGRPRRALPGTVPPWSPDFPPSAGSTRRRAAIRPSGWEDLGRCAAPVKRGCQTVAVKTAKHSARVRHLAEPLAEPVLRSIRERNAGGGYERSPRPLDRAGTDGDRRRV